MPCLHKAAYALGRKVCDELMALIIAANFATETAVDAANGFFGGSFPANNGIGAGDEFQMIPEPATVGMLGLGALSLLLSRRSRKG